VNHASPTGGATRAAIRARIYCSLTDHHGPEPLYSALVTKARREKILGATVIRGIEGYGSHDTFNTSGIVDAAGVDPFIVELVDTQEKLDAFVASVAEWVEVGFVTYEDVTIVVRNARAK